jgi:hypothetical protein
MEKPIDQAASNSHYVAAAFRAWFDANDKVITEQRAPTDSVSLDAKISKNLGGASSLCLSDGLLLLLASSRHSVGLLYTAAG